MKFVPEQRVPFHPLRQGDQFGTGVRDVSRDKKELVVLGRDESTFVIEFLKRCIPIRHCAKCSKIATPTSSITFSINYKKCSKGCHDLYFETINTLTSGPSSNP